MLQESYKNVQEDFKKKEAAGLKNSEGETEPEGNRTSLIKRGRMKNEKGQQIKNKLKFEDD